MAPLFFKKLGVFKLNKGIYTECDQTVAPLAGKAEVSPFLPFFGGFGF